MKEIEKVQGIIFIAKSKKTNFVHLTFCPEFTTFAIESAHALFLNGYLLYKDIHGWWWKWWQWWLVLMMMTTLTLMIYICAQRTPAFLFTSSILFRVKKNPNPSSSIICLAKNKYQSISITIKIFGKIRLINHNACVIGVDRNSMRRKKYSPFNPFMINIH